MLMFTSRL